MASEGSIIQQSLFLNEAREGIGHWSFQLYMPKNLGEKKVCLLTEAYEKGCVRAHGCLIWLKRHNRVPPGWCAFQNRQLTAADHHMECRSFHYATEWKSISVSGERSSLSPQTLNTARLPYMGQHLQRYLGNGSHDQQTSNYSL